jgi:hypothetical protein
VHKKRAEYLKFLSFFFLAQKKLQVIFNIISYFCEAKKEANYEQCRVERAVNLCVSTAKETRKVVDVNNERKSH